MSVSLIRGGRKREDRMAGLSRKKVFENSQVETVLPGGGGGEGSKLQWTCVGG